MVRSVRIRNFKCVRDVTLPLGKLTVFIGRNDTGKSSILQAVFLLSRLCAAPTATDSREWDEIRRVVPQETGKQPRLSFEVEFTRPLGAAEARSSAILTFDHVLSRATCHIEGIDPIIHDDDADSLAQHLVQKGAWDREAAELRKCVLFQIDPRKLSEPSTLGEEVPVPFLKYDGYGLASALRELAVQDSQAYADLKQELARATDVVDIDFKRVQVWREAEAENERVVRVRKWADVLECTLKSGAVVQARDMSDGVLYYLAFLCVTFSRSAPRLLLIEEPENGFHPMRLREVVRLLRRCSERFPETRILMTTHSPYLLDQAKPEEVFAVLRDPQTGSSIHRVSEMPGLDELMGPFSLGELWTNVGEDRIARGDQDA
ncbi:MAG: ATP-binding protein [Planctomycetota bacterium]